ncbi:ABC transporter ATP-binding protein [Gulosibacter sp. 10]|uniref:ABC transporter ATP-binding protein n=1 Tax=Gulosibacter sp. 10 TaxID=1255570 RepID=UPI00097ED03E|nr:ABC transporter ATP-binding protein [Gulosibacter sp. 10]SJM60987.1 Lipid A export ATP-binding/permease protein MsbA [Gulosibacter sp. 10]
MTALHLLRPVRGPLVCAAMLQALASALVFVPLLALIEFARSALAGAPPPGTWFVLAAVAGTVGAAGAGAAATWIAHRADADLAWSLQRRLAEAIRRAPMPTITGMGGGRIKKVVQDDTGALHYLVAHTLVDAAAFTTAPIVGLTALCVYDWRLALCSVLPLVLGVWWYVRAMAGSGAKFGEYAAAQQRINGTVIDYVRGMPAAKVYGGTGGARSRYSTAVNGFHDFFREWSGSTAGVTTASWLVVAPGVTAAFLALVAGAGVGAGWVEPAGLLAAVLLGPMVSAPVAVAGPRIQAVRTGMSALTSIAEMLDTPPLRWGGRSEAQGPASLVEVRHAYDDRVALHEVGVSLPERGLVALVGPSGGGKSTVVSLLARFFDPDGGRVRIGDVDVRDLSEAALYERVAFVFQDTGLRRASVSDSLTGGRDVPRERMIRAARDAAVHEEILALPRGYDTVLGEEGELSGGQRQRVALARALLSDADLLVLDETLSSVDPATRTRLLGVLQQEAARRSVLLVTHQLHLVRDVERILVLDDGLLVGDGDHPTLLEQCRSYRALWRDNLETDTKRSR